MSKVKNIRRSASEMLAASEANTARLRVRAAMDSAKADPALANVLDAITIQDDTLRESSKLLGKGPQSCSTRRTSHDIWLAVINSQFDWAVAGADYAHAIKAGLQKLLANLTTKIASGEKVTASAVSKQVNAVYKGVDRAPFTAIEKEMESAVSARKDWTEAKKIPKKALASA